MKVWVAQSCPTLCDPRDCSLPGSSGHGILEARILEWVPMPSFRRSFQHRDQTLVSCIAGRFFTVWATREPIMFVRGRYSHHYPHIFDLDMFVIFIQLHLILLHFSVLRFTDIVFFCKPKVCGSLVLSKPIGSTFPTIFAHFMSVSHLGNSCNISDFD